MISLLFYLVYMPIAILFVKLVLVIFSFNFIYIGWIIGIPTIAAVQVFERHIFRLLKRKNQYIIVCCPIIIAIFFAVIIEICKITI